MQTALVPQTTGHHGEQRNPDVRANILKPSYDSGFIEFKDLEPYRGHLYHLCPSVPTQPKFIDIAQEIGLSQTGLPGVTPTMEEHQWDSTQDGQTDHYIT